jgi:hypothetical protein
MIYECYILRIDEKRVQDYQDLRKASYYHSCFCLRLCSREAEPQL